MYVDVHAHLIHQQFTGEEDEIARRAREAGVEHVIVNGLEPESNRQVLELCARHDNLLPALGIYPVDAIATEIAAQGWEHPFPPPAPFDAEAEVAFIESVAPGLVAIGEIGLDQHWVKNHPKRQEQIFRGLIEVALKHDKPIIIHSRKAEARTLEILQEMEVKRADFHCYGGKLKLALRIAEAGYYFSIPPVVERAESLFQYLQQVNAAISPPIAAAFIVGVFWPRANGRGAMCALVGGLLAGLVLMVVEPFPFLITAAITFGISITLLVAGSLSAPAPSPEQVEGLTWSRVERALSQQPPAHQRLIFRLSAASTCVTMACLWTYFA